MKFIKTLLIALIATFTLTANAAPKIAISNYPWKKNTLEAMLKDIKSSDVEYLFVFHGMKIGGTGAHANDTFTHTMSPEARAEMQAMLDSYNKKIIGMGHIKFTERDEIESVFKFCKEAGIEIITLEPPAKALKIYDEMAIKYGVNAGVYNHPTTAPYATPEKALAAIKGLEKIKVFGDIGQWGRTKLDIMQCLDKVGAEKLMAVSLQDLSAPVAAKKGKKKGASQDCEEFGKGTLPVKEFVTKLNSEGFDGYYLIMFGNSAQINKVLPSAEYIKALIK